MSRYGDDVREAINETILEALFCTTRFTLDELKLLHRRCGTWDDVVEVSVFAATWNIHSATLAYNRWVEREISPMGIEVHDRPEGDFLND